MNTTIRMIRHDAYLLLLVFLKYVAIGLGLGCGLFLGAVVLGVIKRVGG